MGDKDRSTLLSEIGRDELRAHLRKSEARCEADRQSGLAGVWMPDALDRKYPNAGREFGWFGLFPSRTLSTDPRAGVVRRHHMSDSVIQKAVKAAARKAGHANVETTVIYLHVVKELRNPVRSPLDIIQKRTGP